MSSLKRFQILKSILLKSKMRLNRFYPNLNIALIGTFTACTALLQSRSDNISLMDEDTNGSLIALNPKEWRNFRVSKVDTLTINTKKITFDLQSSNHIVGLPVASCLMAKATIDGNVVSRPYTPLNSNEIGIMELVVKGYENGKMSKHIVNFNVGDTLEMKGPFVKFKYQPNMKKKIGLIAGGSGITPMLQVTQEILRNPDDNTEVTLLFANISEDDIILRDYIDGLVHLYPNFNAIYCIDKPSDTWKGLTGYITSDIINQYMPEPSEENLVMVCGPPPMMFHISGNKAKDKTQGELQGLLKDLGYTSENVYKF